MCYSLVHVFRILKFLVLVNPLFDEDFLQRCKKQSLFLLGFLNFQFSSQQVEGVVCRVAQDFTYTQEMRFVVSDYAAIGRYTDFTVRKCIQRINRLIRGYARRKVNEDLHITGCIIVDLLDFYFPLVVCLQNGLNNGRGCFSIGDFADNKCFVIKFGNLGSHFNGTSALAIVVLGYIDRSPRLKIGI